MKKIYAGNFKANLDFIKRTGLVHANAKILEIGSGSGALLYKLINQGYNISGIEPDMRRIEYGSTVFGELPITPMRGESLRFADESYDIVLSFDVFEHICDSNAHLSEVRRVLRLGGYYLFGTPNKNTNIPWEIISTRSFDYRRYHCALHTRKQLCKRLSAAGFSCSIIDVPVSNDFTIGKITKVFGKFGNLFLMLVNLDRLPRWLRPNIYAIAQKT